jgi:nucleotide-binding universal stress UspA family protein
MAKRKVLIPLDGSEFSRQIVRVVQEFFDPREVSLVLLRVASAPSVPIDAPSARDMFGGAYAVGASYESYTAAMERTYTLAEQESTTLRAQLLDEMRGDADRLSHMGYAVKLEVVFGEPAQRIIQYVSEEQIGLVAMATHGRSGLSRLLLGSIAERVLRSVAAPVLLLRPQESALERSGGSHLAAAFGPFSSLKMLAASDGSVYGARAVSAAAELNRVLGGTMNVLVTTSGREGSARAQEIMRQTVELVAAIEPKPEITPLVGYPDEVVLNYLRENARSLLVIGAFADRSAGGVHSIGPTAHRLVQEAPVSVLLVKGNRPVYKRVLVCASVEDASVVSVAAQMAEAMGAELNLLHVVPPSAAPYLPDSGANTVDVDAVLQQGTRLSTVLREWEAKLNAHGFDRSAIIVQAGSAPELILQHTREGAYDLIVVGSESSPGHFPGSVANTVVRFADHSVLLVRTQAR